MENKPEGKLNKLVIYPQSDETMPSQMYGTREALTQLAGFINQVVTDSAGATTHHQHGAVTRFKLLDCEYPLGVGVCSDEFMDAFELPFFDLEEPDQRKPLDPAPLPAFTKLHRDVLALAPDWQDFSNVERAHRITTAYTRYKVPNRVTPEMLIAAMRRMPDWYQDIEAYFAMSRALNAVIDLHHPDTLVLRSDLDAANVRIVELLAELDAARAELLPI